MTISDIKALLSKITPGEWCVRNDSCAGVDRVYADSDDFDSICSMQVSNCPNFRNDMEFIAASPRIVRVLLRALEISCGDNAEILMDFYLEGGEKDCDAIK